MVKVAEIISTGARAASLQENHDRLNEDQSRVFGASLSMSPQTPQAQWAGILALALTEIGEALVSAALQGSSVDHAEGVHLDSLGSLLSIARRQETFTIVRAQLTGVRGTKHSGRLKGKIRGRR